MKVGDLVQVTHPNGSGCGDHLVPRGTLGVITRLLGDRFRRGDEVLIVAAGVGAPYTYYSSSWEVVSK